MRWYMPCKLGESYPETVFLDWAESRTKKSRVFRLTGHQRVLIGVDVGMRADFCDTPEVFRVYFADQDGHFRIESYSEDKWNFEKLILEVPDAEFEERMVGRRKARLIGFKYSDGIILGHYITGPTYEHFYEPIGIELTYTEIQKNNYIHFEF